jgi:hypothetical protein
MRKRKKGKGFPALLVGGGDFGPPGRDGGPAGPAARGNDEGRRCGAGPTHQQGGFNGADGNGGRGEGRPEFGRRWNPAAVLREARAGAGDYRGGVNLTGGGLGRPVRGIVAGVHGSEVAGEAVRCNMGRGGVPRDRERVAELKH